MELENKMYGMMLEKEIDTLAAKYSDFEIREVLEVAQSKGIVDLEDAYLISKSQKQQKNPIDSQSIKEQIRKEVLAEIEKERKDTATIISTQGDSKPVNPKAPALSAGEIKVAGHMGLSPSEYAKWRDSE